MKTSFELDAEFRDDQGKGASRRLRHAGKVPAILYGGQREPRTLALDHTRLLLMIDNERFYSTIISAQGRRRQPQAAVLKDVQLHPAKNAGPARRPAARAGGREDPHARCRCTSTGAARVARASRSRAACVSHLRNDVEVIVPAEGPAGVRRGRPLRASTSNQMLSPVRTSSCPTGVEIAGAASHGRDAPVVSIHHARAEEVEAPVAEAAATPPWQPPARCRAGCGGSRAGARAPSRRGRGQGQGRARSNRASGRDGGPPARAARSCPGLHHGWHTASRSSSASAIRAPSTRLTRHNAGFWFVDELARSLGAAFSSARALPRRGWPRAARRPRRVAAEAEQAYMNRSGLVGARAAATTCRSPPGEMLVVHDELDLPPGTARLKLGGGARRAQRPARRHRAPRRRTSGGCGSASAIRATATQVIDYVLQRAARRGRAGAARGDRRGAAGASRVRARGRREGDARAAQRAPAA